MNRKQPLVWRVAFRDDLQLAAEAIFICNFAFFIFITYPYIIIYFIHSNSLINSLFRIYEVINC